MKPLTHLGSLFAVLAGSSAFYSVLLAQDKFKDDRPLAVINIKAAAKKIGAITMFGGNPDATIKVKKNSEGHYWGKVSSSRGQYGTGTHPYFVVDIVVPAAFKVENIPNAAVRIYAMEANPHYTEVSCDNALARWCVFLSSSFAGTPKTSPTGVASESKAGQWVPFADMGVAPYCDIGLKYRVNLPGPARVTRTYRVMAKATKYGVIVPVTVGWTWDY